MTETLIKLNLGSGACPLPGYVNLDIKQGQAVYPLQLEGVTPCGVDEIRASHILEHFPHGEVLNVLKNWAGWLKPGGVLKIAVPDFGKLARSYAAGTPMNYIGYLMGGQVDDHDVHKALFDEAVLRRLLTDAGLVDIQPWTSEIRDCASLPISLNLMGTKPDVKSQISVTAAQLQPAVDVLKTRVRNVYSQFGEDGILGAIFEAIGMENQWCLEVGAGDGIIFSNTRRLVEQGWRAILIEKDQEAFQRLCGNTLQSSQMYGACRCENFEIGIAAPNSLDAVLSKHGAPEDIDLVSIDVDGQDWHVCNAMLQYRPRVLLVEYAMEGNARLYRGPEFIPTIGGEGQAGCKAVQRLLCGKGYIPVAVTPSNVIAVRGDLARKLLALSETKNHQSLRCRHRPRRSRPSKKTSQRSSRP